MTKGVHMVFFDKKGQPILYCNDEPVEHRRITLCVRCNRYSVISCPNCFKGDDIPIQCRCKK